MLAQQVFNRALAAEDVAERTRHGVARAHQAEIAGVEGLERVAGEPRALAAIVAFEERAFVGTICREERMRETSAEIMREREGGKGTVREECEGGVAFGVGHFGVGVARDHYRAVVSFGFKSTFRCCLAVMICHSVSLDAVVIVQFST